MGRRRAVLWALGLVVILAAARVGLAVADEPPALPGSDDCAMCHEPGRMGGRRIPDTPPPFGAAALRASPHATLECTSCHADLAGQEYPHAAKLQPVDCGSCHDGEMQQFRESLHGQAAARGDKLAPSCKSCHGKHDVLRPSDLAAPTSTVNVPTLCNSCHREGSPVQAFYNIPQDSILENYKESIHGEGLYRKGLLTTAVCTSCHTAHHQLSHTDARSSISRDNIAKTCEKCHVRIEIVHRKVIRGDLWEKGPGAVPACVDCHEPHRARKVFYTQGMADEDCMSCHVKEDVYTERDGERIPMHVDRAEVQASAHGKIACAQCHTGADPSQLRPCSTITNKVDCSICHPEVVATYRTSTHGQLSAKGSPDAPVCADCHGTHGVTSNRVTDSKTYARNIPALCGKCHRTGEKAAVRYTGPETQILESYEESIHGKGLIRSGLVVTATCVDCHTAHGELPHTDPASSVFPANVALTCAQCHRGIYEQFESSIHSPKVSDTKKELPVCADCHSAHRIGRTDQTNFRLEIMEQCGRCHRELAETYFDTYHGKVSKLGYLKTAKCYDCHGAHDILPTYEPASHLSRQNIIETCGRCHPGSNRRFAGYLTHATHHDPQKYPALFWTFWGMTGLLVGTFAFFGLHTLAWLPRSLRYRRELIRSHALESAQHVQRFPRLYRRLHVMVIVSFIGLAVTGMSLKFSYTDWARFLSQLLGGFETAGFIHRICAVITFAYFALHVWDLLRRRSASGQSWREFISGTSGMLPGKRDFVEFGQSMKWFVGRGPRPEYGRWTYWEKFDYFAVFWGVAVIGSTGLLLWFPEFFTRVIPGPLLNVATVIHSDEALLAVGFIFTIHFFNTHFRPEKFPMDTVIFTGTIPLDEFKQDRPREYEELVRTGRLTELLTTPPDPKVVRNWRIFGSIALTIGIGLIVLIIYAAIFRYR